MMGSFNLTRIVDGRPAIDDAISLAPVVLVDGGEVKVVDESVLDAVRELGGHHLPRLRVDPVPESEHLLSGRCLLEEDSPGELLIGCG